MLTLGTMGWYSRPVTLIALLLLSFPKQASGQSSSSVSGTILIDPDERPIAGALVTLSPTSKEVRSDSAGTFFIGDLSPGSYTVVVRAPGYASLTSKIVLESGERFAADFLLRPTAQRLAGVDVTAKAPSGNNPRIKEFDERRKIGLGHFIVQADFEREEGRKLADILRARVAGVSVMSYAGRSALYSSRGLTSLGGASNLDPIDRRQGAQSRCFVQIILDDILLYTGRNGDPLFDINSIDASRLAGAEFYSVAARPAQFNRGGSGSCGTLVLWSRY